MDLGDYKTGESKDKDSSEPGPKFLVGMDNRPVRWPMTDETFNEFRTRLLEAPDTPVISVTRGSDGVVTIVAPSSETQKVIGLMGPLVVEFSIGNPIAVVPPSSTD